MPSWRSKRRSIAAPSWFPSQPLTDEEQIAFSRLFGPLETSIGTIRKNRKHRLRSELADISNLDGENNIRAPGDAWRMMLLANQLWHTDSSFKRVPGKISLLSAREVRLREANGIRRSARRLRGSR